MKRELAIFLKIILFTVFFFLPLSLATSRTNCILVPVGQIPRRLLEIQDELIFLSVTLGEKYAQLIPHAVKLRGLLEQCDTSKCEVGNCPLPCTPQECPPGTPCKEPSGGEEICPPVVKDGIEKEVKEIERIFREAVGETTPTRLGNLLKELGDLKVLLGSAEELLRETHPGVSILSCNEALTLNLVKSCSKKEIETLGIRRPCLGAKGPNSIIDYYIWPR